MLRMIERDQVPISSDDVALEANGLIKIYRGADSPALDGIDLKIKSGSIFGLLGPNGAGKTTAISIMSTLIRPTSGSVRIFDVNSDNEPARIRE